MKIKLSALDYRHNRETRATPKVGQSLPPAKTAREYKIDYTPRANSVADHVKYFSLRECTDLPQRSCVVPREPNCTGTKMPCDRQAGDDDLDVRSGAL